MNLAESFLRGIVGELPERPASSRTVIMLLARRGFPAWKFRRDIRGRGGFAKSSCARKSFPASQDVVEMFEEAVEFSFQTEKNLRVDLVLERRGVKDGLEGRRLCFESERFVQHSETRLRLG